MNVLLFGSTGPTGREVLKIALEQNHRVTAFARNPGDLNVSHANLRAVRGDITDPKSIDAVMAGQEVVVSTLGVRRITRNTVLSDGTRNILNSMREYKVRRFICETSVGVGDSRGQMGWIFDHLILTTFLKAVFADKEVQEQYIKSSDTDWIILRPAMLTNGPRTGVYQCWSGAKPAKAKMKISRADVADFAVTNFSEANYLRQAISLSY